MRAEVIASIIISVYNGRRHIGPALRSVLAQTIKSVNLIIADDGSTDGTGEVLARLALEDSRVHVVTGGGGLTRSLNIVAARARGRYLARMDADDIALPDRLAKQVEFLEANPEVGLVGTWAYQIDGRGRIVGRYRSPTEHEAMDAGAMRGGTPVCHPSIMIRRSVFEQIGGYDERLPYAQDLDLCLRVAEVSRLATLPEFLMMYRVHGGAISESKREQQLECSKLAHRWACERRGVDTAFDAPQDWRPDKSLESRYKFNVLYGHGARRHGEWAGSLHYAMRAIATRPFGRPGWGVLRRLAADVWRHRGRSPFRLSSEVAEA